MEGAGLPLLHAPQLRPQRGADQGLEGDPEEGEVLEVGVVPQLGEQVGLLHWRPGAHAPCALAAFSAAPPPLGRDHSGQTSWEVLLVAAMVAAVAVVPEDHLLPMPLGH